MGMLMKICMPMREEGRVDDDLHPTMEVEDKGGGVDKGLHAIMEMNYKRQVH